MVTAVTRNEHTKPRAGEALPPHRFGSRPRNLWIECATERQDCARTRESSVFNVPSDSPVLACARRDVCACVAAWWFVASLRGTEATYFSFFLPGGVLADYNGFHMVALATQVRGRPVGCGGGGVAVGCSVVPSAPSRRLWRWWCGGVLGRPVCASDGPVGLACDVVYQVVVRWVALLSALRLAC